VKQLDQINNVLDLTSMSQTRWLINLMSDINQLLTMKHCGFPTSSYNSLWAN